MVESGVNPEALAVRANDTLDEGMFVLINYTGCNSGIATRGSCDAVRGKCSKYTMMIRIKRCDDSFLEIGVGLH